MPDPVRPSTAAPPPGAPKIPGFDDLPNAKPAPGAPASASSASSSSSSSSTAIAGFDDLPDAKPTSSPAAAPRKNTPVASSTGKSEDEPTVTGELKAFGRNLTSVEGLKKIGAGLYHGIVDPAATVAEHALDDPRTVQLEQQHERELEAVPGAPVVHNTRKEILSDAAVTAASAIPVGELAGAGVAKGAAKVAPSAAARVAELLAGDGAKSAIARGAVSAGESAVHGAAVGAASSPDHPGVGAALGALGGAATDVAAQGIAKGAGAVKGAVGDRVKAAKIVPPESMADVHELVKDPRGYVVKKYDEARHAVQQFDAEQEAAAQAKAAARQPGTATQVRQLPASTAHEPDYTIEANPAPPPKPAPPEIPPEELITHLDDRIKALLEQRDVARREAETDPLTGLGNRAALDRALPNAEAHPRTAIVAFDANNFGKINKTAGQAAGDAALKELGGALAQAANEHPGVRLFRRGGDEFVALAPTEHAEAFRQAAEQHFGDRQYGEHTVSLTGHTGNTFAEADAGLQAAKAARKAATNPAAAPAGSSQEAGSAPAAPSGQGQPPEAGNATPAAPEGFADLPDAEDPHVRPDGTRDNVRDMHPEAAEIADLAEQLDPESFKRAVAGRTITWRAHMDLGNHAADFNGALRRYEEAGHTPEAAGETYLANLDHARTLPHHPPDWPEARTETLVTHKGLKIALRHAEGQVFGYDISGRVPMRGAGWPMERSEYKTPERTRAVIEGAVRSAVESANRKPMYGEKPTKHPALTEEDVQALTDKLMAAVEGKRPTLGKPTKGRKGQAIAPSSREELEREHAELLAQHQQRAAEAFTNMKPAQRRAAKVERSAELATLERRLDAVRTELAEQHGVDVKDWRDANRERKAKLKDRGASSRASIEKKPTKPDAELHPTARTMDGERFRPYHTVSVAGLVDEMASLRDRIAERSAQTAYRTAQTDEGEAITVSTRTGAGPSTQAKALQNITDWQRRIDEIAQHLEATRGLSKQEIDELETEALMRHFEEAERQKELAKRGREGESDEAPDDSELEGADPVPFEVGPRYGLHGPKEPLRDDITVPAWRRRPVPGALERTRATANYPREGGEAVKVYRGDAHAFGDLSTEQQDYRALYGRPPKDGAYFTERPDVAETYTRKGTLDTRYMKQAIAAEEKEVRAWAAGEHPLQRQFEEIKAGLDPEERAEEEQQLKDLERRAKESLADSYRRLHEAEQSQRPNMRVARLDVRRPFDAEALIDEQPGSPEDVLEDIFRSAWELFPDYDWDDAREQLDKLAEYHNLAGEDVYRTLQHTAGERSMNLGPTGVNEILEHAGFDAITHIGGKRTGSAVDHRVWIPFHRESILSAFGEPHSAYVVGETPEHYGAHYRAQLAERAAALEPEDAKQLELTFGSPEQGLAAADRVVRIAGKDADITPEPPPSVPRYRERAAAVARGATFKVQHASVSLVGKLMRSTEHAARLFQIGRDPQMEHMQLVVLDDEGRILHHERWTSGAINYVSPPMSALQAFIERAYQIPGAVSVVPAHNHPSGNVAHSNGDAMFTGTLDHALAQVGQALGRRPLRVPYHIIVDHDRYTVLRVTPAPSPTSVEAMSDGRTRAPGEYDVAAKEFRLTDLSESGDGPDWTELTHDRQIRGHSDVHDVIAGRVAAVRDGKHIDVLYLNNQNRTVAWEALTAAQLRGGQLVGHLAEAQRNAGAAAIVLAVGDALRARALSDANYANATGRANVLDVVQFGAHPDTGASVISSALATGTLKASPHGQGGGNLVDAWRVLEPSDQLGMFGDLPEAPRKPSMADQLGMFGELEGTKLAQDEAKKLANKDEKIGADELAQRRDELGAPKPPTIKAGEDQGGLFDRAPRYGAGDEPERVQQAAVRVRGQTFEGMTHAHALDEAADHFGLDNAGDLYGEMRAADEGFTTTRGRYVTRAEAHAIAARAGQIDADDDGQYEGAEPTLHAGDAELATEHLDPLFERGPQYGAPRTDAEAAARILTVGDLSSARVEQSPVEYGKELADSFNRAFNPAARGDLAKDAARIVRRETGQHAREIERATEAAKAAKKMFAKMPRAEQLAFIDRMETGKPQPTRELQLIADAFRQALDSARAAVQQLGTGKLQSWIENYFPHIWKNPKKAGIFFGKRPMEGSKSFLKHREIPTIADGIAAGLEPVSTNPADLAVLKLREMHRYILAWRILNDLTAKGLAKWISVRRKPPEGWAMIDDRVATRYGKPTVTVAHAEGFDATLREGLEQVFKDLNISHRRELTDKHAGPGTWGYAWMKGPLAGKDMWTRFGGDVGTMVHELGHLLDARYGLWDHLIDKPKKKLNSKGKSVSADSPEEIQKRKELNAELRALADMRDKGPISKSRTAYLHNRAEKIANAIDAMLNAPELAMQVAPTITTRLRAFFAARPELKPLLELKRGVRRGTDARVKEYDTGGVVIKAKLYAPEPVARVVNNYLSPGLRGSPYYNAYMGVGNLLNAAQLGLSAFHLGFTSLDASVSKFGLALEQAAQGQPIKALTSAALVPTAPLTNVLKGNKVLREYLHPGTQGAAFGELADAVARAGGRVRMDEWYRAGQWDAMKQAMTEAIRGADWKARAGGAAEAAVRALPAALELAAKPLMEYIVPRQKLGVFADLARQELDRLAAQYPQGAPVDVVESALQRAWDSVDNRMGQMVYDNLFWHKIGKDLAHAGMRSVGWNVGTVRELAGGVGDAVHAGGELVRRARGKGASSSSPSSDPLFTHRMAYLVALPLVVGLAGAVLQYLYTGKGPDALRDLYYPKTGRATPEGDDERLELPSYMKNVGAVMRHPVTTVEHKLSPMLDLVTSMLENKDYYGDEIMNPDDAPWKRIEQGLAYVGKSFTPFSVQGALEEGKRGGSRLSRALSMIGVTPAPREVTRSPLQQSATEIASRRAQGIQTPEERDATQAKQELVRREREGENVSPELREALANGELSVADVRRIRRAGFTDAEAKRFAQLSLEDLRQLMPKATADERTALAPLIARKLRAARERHALPAGFSPP